MSWRTVPLKRLATIRVSNVDKKFAEGETPVRLCNYTDVYYRDTIAPNQKFMAATATAEQMRAFRLVPDDVVITKDSETADDIGVPAYVAAGAPDLICGYHLAILRPNSSGTDGRFLFWLMSSLAARSQLEVAATGVTRFGLRTDAIGDVRLGVPGIGEQRAIADFLDAETARIDALVARKRHLVETLDETCMSVMTDGARGVLTGAPQESTDLPWIESRAAGWQEAKLSLIARLGTGHTPSREHPEWWVDCTIPWITTGEVSQMRSDRIEFVNDTRESISSLGLQNSSAVLHPAGTVVLSRTASAGYSAIMDRDMATSQDFVTWTCGPLLRPRFLLLCLRVMRQDLLGRLAMGSTHQTIYMPDIESLRVVLPPVAEQDRVVDALWERLRPIHRTVDRITRQVELLQEHRQALITAAVTGELDVVGVAA